MIHRFALAMLAAVALPFGALAQVGPPQDRYIVVLSDVLDLPEDVAVDVALRAGGEVGYVYNNALRGFSIVMPRAAASAIARDPRVAYVEEDRPVSIVAQEVPTGIDRTFASGNVNLDIDGTDDYRVDVDVAVIDTGVDFQHPDLNVVGGTDCTLRTRGGGPFATRYCGAPGEGNGGDDDHYHGTHVAGTIGALDNGIGVVGVAPGARIWAVKVLDSSGSGYTSGIIAGIDWVVAKAGTDDRIEVLNMSLGGAGVNTAYEDAIERAAVKGIVSVVAAGNNDADARNYSPAFVEQAITVSALADFDGLAGGNGVETCRSDQDDTLADFSNWGPAIDVAAPGVCILSTYPLEMGEYGTISGTSMAAPHVAGAAALLASANPPTGAEDVATLATYLLADGNSDWTDDSGDGITEPLLDISDATLFAPVFVAGGGETGGGDDGGGGDENPPAAGGFSLSATGYKVKGIQHADLSWSGDSAGSFDVRRDGSVISTVATGTAYTDPIGHKGGGSYVYKVCETGAEASCSNEVTVTF